jgi:hypothetical protein
MNNNDRPFQTIEDTQAFLGILSDTIDEIVAEAGRELSLHRFERRRAQAWQVVIYKATKLSSHIANSRRIMNDLLTVRNVLDEITDVQHGETSATTVKSPFIRQEAPASVRRSEPCVV